MAMAMSAAGVVYAADKKDEEDTDWASQVTEEISCDIVGWWSRTAGRGGRERRQVLLDRGQSALGGNGTGALSARTVRLTPNLGEANARRGRCATRPTRTIHEPSAT